MSCIAAIVEYGKIYMGSDRISFDESTQIRNRKDPKIFQNGPFMIGYAGEIRPGQVLRPEYWKPPKTLVEIPNSIRSQLNKSGCCHKSTEGADETPTTYLIGCKGQLIEIGHDFQLIEFAENFTSIGAGANYALSILYHTRKEKDPVKRLKDALESASYFCGAVGVLNSIYLLENDEAVEIK